MVLQNGCSEGAVDINGTDVHNSVTSESSALDLPEPSSPVPDALAAEESIASTPSALQEDEAHEDIPQPVTDRRSDSVASNPPLTPTSITRVPSQVGVVFFWIERLNFIVRSSVNLNLCDL